MVEESTSATNSFSGDALAAELDRLGVRFVVASADDRAGPLPTAEELIAGLAGSSEARLRMALIPLFIRHPALGEKVEAVSHILIGQARLTLVCYYTAAHLLRGHFADRLAALNLPTTALPDHFGHDLGLPAVGESDELLHILAQRHEDLSGRPVNWYGTYLHAADTFLRQLELAPA